jgi:lipopolysaccharide biosynthesis glycosyltransferase
MKLKADHFFGIGLSRTGTDSLGVAFDMLGLKAKHLPRGEEIKNLDNLKQYHFADDISIASRYKELDEKFPNSKFIYTVRDVDKWIISCKRFWESLENLIAFSEKYKDQPQSDIWEGSSEIIRMYGQLRFDEDVFRKRYAEHDKEIREYFKDRPDDLLIMDVCNGDGWEKMIPFITDEYVEVNHLFPWSNKKTTWPDSNIILPLRECHDKTKCIATVCDKKFLVGLETMVSSLIRHTPTFKWDIVVLSPDMVEEDLGRLAKIYPFIRLVRIDTQKYDEINQTLMQQKPGANGAYYKYDVFSLDEYDRVLFLDSDTIIVQDIWELLACKEDIAMVPEMFIDQFNTGVMSISKKYLNADTVKKLIALTRQIGPTDHVDQDIINHFFDGRVKPLSMGFNFLKIYHNYSFMGGLSPHIKILHYVIHKPWTSYQPLTIEEGCGWLDKYWHIERNEFVKKTSD